MLRMWACKSFLIAADPWTAYGLHCRRVPKSWMRTSNPSLASAPPRPPCKLRFNFIRKCVAGSTTLNGLQFLWRIGRSCAISKHLDRRYPQSREAADHSFTFLPAVALLDGELTLRQFENSRWKQPLVRRLMQRISLEGAPDLNQRAP